MTTKYNNGKEMNYQNNNLKQKVIDVQTRYFFQDCGVTK